METDHLIFDHIPSGEEGSSLSSLELAAFALSIAASLLEEKGERVLSCVRMLKSDTPVAILKDRIVAVPFAMYPGFASLTKEEEDELRLLSLSIGKPRFSYPIALYCMTGSGELPIPGASYIVKENGLISFS